MTLARAAAVEVIKAAINLIERMCAPRNPAVVAFLARAREVLLMLGG